MLSGRGRTSPAPRRRLDLPREPSRFTLPRFSSETFGRFAERFATFMGTPRFLLYMTVFVIVWVSLNVVAWRWAWDPYPFILLNLFFSTQASYAAPLILLAQNRQTERDRLALDEDRRRAAMQKADTEFLARELASLRLALGEVATRDFIRSELSRMLEELEERTSEPQEAEDAEVEPVRRRPDATRRR
jgi:Predicted membrane protein